MTLALPKKNKREIVYKNVLGKSWLKEISGIFLSLKGNKLYMEPTPAQETSKSANKFTEISIT